MSQSGSVQGSLFPNQKWTDEAGIFFKIPVELVEEIFKQLAQSGDSGSILSFMLTRKIFYQIGNQKSIWRIFTAIKPPTKLPHKKTLIKRTATIVNSCQLAYQKITELAGAHSITLSPDGKWGLTGSNRGQACIGSFGDKVQKWSLPIDDSGCTITCFSLSQDGLKGAVGDSEGAVRILDLEKRIQEFKHSRRDWTVNSVAFSKSGERLIIGGNEGVVQLLDCKSKRCLQFHASSKRIFAVTFLPDEERFAAAGGDGVIRIWPQSEYKTLEGHTDMIYSIATSQRGKKLYSGSRDKTIKIWSLDSYSCLTTLKGHTGPVHSITLATDDTRLVSGSGDKTIKVWHLPTASLLATIEGHQAPVYGVSLSSNGKWLMSTANTHYGEARHYGLKTILWFLPF